MNKNLSLKDVLLGKVRLGPMHPNRQASIGTTTAASNVIEPDGQVCPGVSYLLQNYKK